MKKLKRIASVILCTVLLCTFSISIPVPTFAAADYTTVVPFQPTRIYGVSDVSYILSPSENQSVLYDFDGNQLFSASSMSFNGDYLEFQNGTKYGIAALDGTVLIPAKYDWLEMRTSLGYCLAAERFTAGDSYHFIGKRYQIDLKTGKVIQDLGQGDTKDLSLGKNIMRSGVSFNQEILRDESNLYQTRTTLYRPDGTQIPGVYSSLKGECGDILFVTSFENPDSCGGIDWQGNVIVPFSGRTYGANNDGTPPYSSWEYNMDRRRIFSICEDYLKTPPGGDLRDYIVYNQGGEKVLEPNQDVYGGGFSHAVAINIGPTTFYTLKSDPDSGITTSNYDDPRIVFTDRGRRLGVFSFYNYSELNGGDYIYLEKEPEGGGYVIDRDGQIVIPKGMFDYISTCGSNSHSNYLIVRKNGQYAVISLPPYICKPSPWAASFVEKASQKRILPDDLQDFVQENCTRGEFCRMLSLAVKEASGKSLPEHAAMYSGVQPTFTDSTDPDVLAAAKLGILTGVGKNRFASYQFITREQAAVMLSQSAALLHIRPDGASPAFTDSDSFASWSAPSIAKITAITADTDGNHIMEGTGGGRFSPQDRYTVEQACITLLRLVSASERSGTAEN